MRNLLLLSVFLFLIGGCSSPEREPVATDSEIIDIWDNGRPKMIRLYAEVAGELEAIREIHYYSDGSKNLEGPLLNGEREGLWKSWYEDGTLWSEGNFANGKRQGQAVVYHPNGLKMIEGQYHNNERTGMWRSWDEDGNLINEIIMSKPE